MARSQWQGTEFVLGGIWIAPMGDRHDVPARVADGKPGTAVSVSHTQLAVVRGAVPVERAL